jgi:cytochrome c oxidase subunit 4
MSETTVPIRVYYVIFATLLLLTLVTVDVAFFNIGLLSLYVALAIATTKATLVALYFMHVRYSPRLTGLVLVTGFFFLVVMIVLTVSDLRGRGWLAGS